MAEFAYNNSRNGSTGMWPFRALMGFNPQMGDAVQKQSRRVLEDPAAKERAEELLDMSRVLQVELRQAYKSQKEYHDRHTSRMLFAPGEKVWLSAKNIRTTRPCKKLDYKRHGPFTVPKVIGKQAYRLDLPKMMKIYPVFHVSLLELYKGSNDDEEPPPPILQDDMEEYELEQVLDSRFTRGKLQYRMA